MRLRTIRFAAPLLLSLVLVVGCSSDGDSDSGSASRSDDRSTSTSAADAAGGGSTESTVPNPKPPPAPDRTKYCQVWKRLVTTTAADFDSGDPSSVKAHYNAVLGVARELEAVAPLDIKGAVQVAIRETERVAQTGDTSANDTDESRVNGKRLQDYAAQYCK